MKKAAHVALVEQVILPTLRDALGPTTLLGNAVVLDSLAEDSCLSVNIHLVVVKAHAKNVIKAVTLRNGVKLIGCVPPVQVDPPFMQVRQDQ